MSHNPYATPGAVEPPADATGVVTFAGQNEYADALDDEVLRKWFIFGLVFPGMAVLFLMLAFGGIEDEPANPRWLWGLLCIPALYLSRWFQIHMESRAYKPVPFEGDLSGAGLRVVSEGAESREPWAEFSGYRMRAGGELLVLKRRGRKPVMLLPRRLFRDADDWRRAVSMVERQLDTSWGSPTQPWSEAAADGFTFSGVVTHRHLRPYINLAWERQSLLGTAGGCVVVALIYVLPVARRGHDLTLSVALVGVGLVFGLAYSLQQRWYPRRYPVAGSASPQGLQLREGKTTWDFPWAAFTQIQVDDQGPEPMALLYEASGQVRFVARSFLADDAQWQGFVALCQKGIAAAHGENAISPAGAVSQS